MIFFSWLFVGAPSGLCALRTARSARYGSGGTVINILSRGLLWRETGTLCQVRNVAVYFKKNVCPCWMCTSTTVETDISHG